MLLLRGGNSGPESQRLYADYSTALSEDIPSFRRTITRGRGQRPAMKMRQTHRQSPYESTKWSRATWIYARAPARAKWLTDAPIRLPLEFRSSAKSLLRKILLFTSSDCIAEATCRSSWPIRHCLEKSNRTPTQLL